MRNREILDVAKVANERVGRLRVKEQAKEEEIVEEKQAEYESGYSEAQQALDIEMRRGDLSSLKKSKAFQSLPGNIKRLVAYRTVTIRLKDLLITYTDLMKDNPHRAQKLLEEILSLRTVEIYLFDKIIGRIDKKLDISQVYEEVKVFLI